MVKKSTHNSRQAQKRFTITLDQEDYTRLRELAKNHHPRLSLQYVVQYAITAFLEQVEEPQLLLGFGDPTEKNRLE